MKVIIVDDHTLFRGGFALLFKQFEEAAEVLEGGCLDDAVELAGQHPDADLMLLDLNMPGMHGPHSIAQMAEAYPQLPLIVISADDTKENVQAVLSAGASGFIPKSSNSAVMQSAIRLVLSGGVYLPPQLLRAEAPETGEAHE